MRTPVAVIGAGMIGRGWAIVFARAGYAVRMYDAQPGACDAALAEIERRLHDLERYELVREPGAILARLTPVSSIAEAAQNVDLVQECVLENRADKRAIFEELDRCTPERTAWRDRRLMLLAAHKARAERSVDEPSKGANAHGR